MLACLVYDGEGGMKKLINIKKLAEYLDTKVSTIYSWIHMKQIPHYKVGRLVKFDVAEIDKWLQERKQEVLR